jgi:hypothetical protein
VSWNFHDLKLNSSEVLHMGVFLILPLLILALKESYHVYQEIFIILSFWELGVEERMQNNQ